MKQGRVDSHPSKLKVNASVYGLRGCYINSCCTSKLKITEISRNGRIKEYTNKNGREYRQDASCNFFFQATGVL